jgi:DNA-binding beta-propeller fold protein YncE
MAIGMLSPGPVVITATFVGYLVAGFWGSLAATVGRASLVLACLVIPVKADEVQMAPLTLERTIALPHVSGRIDHMAVDLRRGRLFVAELGNNTVDVVDLAAGHAIHRIEGLKEPQGIAYSPGPDVVAVANAGDGSVRFYTGQDYEEVARTDLGEDADNVRLDPLSGNFLVGYGSGGLATLNGNSGAVIGKAKLPAHPEGFRVDAHGHRALVNVPDAGQIAVVDLASGKQTASWRVPGLRANFPMAWDEANRIIAVVFRSPTRLVLLDSDTGAVRETRETCGDADDVFFDNRRHRIYVSCGSGSVDVFGADNGTYRLLSRIPTSSGARTSLFVPELDRLFVAQRAGLWGAEAALLVLRPAP